MGYQDDINRLQEKEDLITSVKQLCGGAEPTTIRGVLRALSHPDIKAEVLEFFSGTVIRHTCLVHEAPWNCMREYDAKYENMRYGMLGGSDGADLQQRWCQPCRERGWDDYEE